MHNEAKYVRALAPGVEMHVRLSTRRGSVNRYAVAVVVIDEGRRLTVRLFDNSHGVNDMHRYTRDGEKRVPEVFHHGSASEAFNAALKAVLQGWTGMVSVWRS